MFQCCNCEYYEMDSYYEGTCKKRKIETDDFFKALYDDGYKCPYYKNYYITLKSKVRRRIALWRIKWLKKIKI